MDLSEIITSIILVVMGIVIFHISLGKSSFAKFMLEEATKNRMRSAFYRNRSFQEVQKGIRVLLKVASILFIIFGIWRMILEI